ncbi:MAG: amino acid permease, partial [Candidatus Lokiarchaeota archaeon]|nr:amino acid permease [Candidatus Lokiarchaeota archaeon]
MKNQKKNPRNNEKAKIKPKKPLGIWSSILYGIGCGIGGSIFILLGNAINIAGPGVLISLGLGGILIFFTALNYSELSISLPVSGGAYNFSKEGLGGFLAYIIGFFFWIANIGTVVFSSLAFALVIYLIFPALASIKIIIALASILFISIVVFRTQKIALKSLIFLTIVLIGIFTFFTFSGFFIAPSTNSSNFDPGYISTNFNFFTTIQMFSILFICFTSITSNLAYINPMIKNRSKNIPRVNMLAIFFTSFIYIIITIVVLINIGSRPEDYSDKPILLAEVLRDILGDFGFYLMGIAAIISTLIAMNAALGSAMSVLNALARDHYVTSKLKAVDKKRNVPIYSLMVTTIISICLVLLVNIDLAAQMTSFIYFFGLAFVNFAAVGLRYKRKELARPFKAPYFPYLPIIVGATFLILSFTLSDIAKLTGLIIFLLGLIYYLLTIADRPSILLTIAGLKFFSVIIIGFFIWILKNISTINSSIPEGIMIFDLFLLRILIFFGIFVIITVIFDIIPIREIVYSFVKRIDREKIAITIGEGRIIELEKKHTRIIYY